MTEYAPGDGPPPRIYTEDEALAVVAGSRQGVLATVKRDGSPHLSNMLYVWDPDQRALLMSTKAPRVKVKHLRNNPRAAVQVAGDNFFSYAVAEGVAEISEVTTTPGDAAGRALRAAYPEVPDEQVEELYEQLVKDERVLITLRVTKAHGMVIELDGVVADLA
ncbi:PPOX class F420-dependent oxidoreductase [Kibdelosporangium lantanae]